MIHDQVDHFVWIDNFGSPQREFDKGISALIVAESGFFGFFFWSNPSKSGFSRSQHLERIAKNGF